MAVHRRTLSALAVLALAACDGAPPSELRFVRADGSTIDFPRDVRAWCGPWDADVPTPALHVGTVARPVGDDSFWLVSAVERDARSGRRVRYPLEYVWNRPHGAHVFVLDLAGARSEKNEASTQTEDSGGWIELDFGGSCEMGASVGLTVDAVIGSEFGDGEPIEVEGRLRLEIGRPPPGF